MVYCCSGFWMENVGFGIWLFLLGCLLIGVFLVLFIWMGLGLIRVGVACGFLRVGVRMYVFIGGTCVVWFIWGFVGRYGVGKGGSFDGCKA